MKTSPSLKKNQNQQDGDPGQKRCKHYNLSKRDLINQPISSLGRAVSIVFGRHIP